MTDVERWNVPLLDVDENAVMDALVEAWNKFLQLPELHPTHRRDFMDAIHTAQRLVMIRPVCGVLVARDGRWWETAGSSE